MRTTLKQARWFESALILALGVGSGVCLAGTLFPRRPAGALALVLAAAVVACLRAGVQCSRAPSGTTEPRQLVALERWAPWLNVLFFVPLLSHPVAPGADMAMYAALARSLLDGAEALSPAWGDVSAEAYPLGFSACVAWLGHVMDLGRATVLASACSFALYWLGLSRFFADVGRLAHPRLMASLLLFASWTPQAFYRWGGGPSVLAMAFGLLAAAELALALEAEEVPMAARVRLGVASCGLLLAAMATHPIGACIGAACVGFVVLRALLYGARARRAGRVAGLGLLVFVPLAALMLWLSRHGPVLSAREISWIREFQRVDENVLGPWPRWLFPLTVWRALFVRVGPVISGCYVAACIWLRTRAWRSVLVSLALIEALGVSLAYGPELPSVGFLIYPSRLMPAAVLMLAPPLSAAVAEGARLLSETWLRAAVAIVAVASLAVHTGLYQRAEPMVTRSDLRAMQCLAAAAPAQAVVDGAYGDASQWVPALTGLTITHPHVHCSLFDEVDRELAQRRPTHRFVGERVCYGQPLAAPLPRSAPLCRHGRATLFELGAEARDRD